MNEIWKDIEDFIGIYQVSNLGNVRSIDRKVFNKGNNSWCYKKGRIMLPNLNKRYLDTL